MVQMLIKAKDYRPNAFYYIATTYEHGSFFETSPNKGITYEQEQKNKKYTSKFVKSHKRVW